MKIFQGPPRKDGKRKCTYVFTNGVHITKLLTSDQVKAETDKGTPVLPSRR